MSLERTKFDESQAAGSRAEDWGRYLTRILALLLFFARGLNCSGTEEPTQREYELKAAVLYHIIEYVEWPSEALSSQSATLQLGLIGDIPFAGAIELMNGKLVQGRKLVVDHLQLNGAGS